MAKQKPKEKKKSEGSKGGDGVIEWTIWAFLLICFEKYFEKNCCFWQLDFRKQQILI